MKIFVRVDEGYSELFTGVDLKATYSDDKVLMIWDNSGAVGKVIGMFQVWKYWKEEA